MRFVESYFNHPKIGCGVRHAFVVREKNGEARLFFPATARAVTVPSKLLDKAKDITPTTHKEAVKLAKRIKEVLTSRKRMHLSIFLTDARTVLTALRDVGVVS